MKDHTLILNRIKKNKNRLKSYVKDLELEAFRLYDRDIPEYPYIIDIYGSKLVIFEKGKRLNEQEIEKKREHLNHITQALSELFPSYEQIVKERVQNKGKSQYEKEKNTGKFFTVKERGIKFEVNVEDYIDCGLFLDHRPLRGKIEKLADGKKILNLFCYTGSLSVAAAYAKDAVVTSVDMSNTYLDWAKRNFDLNGINQNKHQFIRADITDWIKTHQEGYDIIILDPPSFSNSKKMDESFDIQRDHIFLLEELKKNLNENAILYFSNNLRNFKLDPSISEIYLIKDISKESIPPDFRDPKIHHCFELRQK